MYSLMQLTNYLIYSVGFAFILYYLLKFLKFLQNNCTFCQPSLIDKYGVNSWCTIVGASDGIGQISNNYIIIIIGKEFCFQMAAQGFNICLIGRNKQKIELVEKEMKAKFPTISSRILIYDFVKQFSDEQLYQKLYDDLKDLDISILINAVGIMTPGKLHQLSENDAKKMIITNIFPFIFVTQKLLEKLLNRKQKSLIINLSSLSSQTLTPFFSVLFLYQVKSKQIYAGTKSFTDWVSQHMSIEYQDKLDVLSLRPNLVRTKLQTLGLNALFKYGEISSQSCVKGCLSQIRNGATDGHIWHQIINYLFQFIPNKLSFFVLKKWFEQQQKLK